jgi:hypothetical protein
LLKDLLHTTDLSARDITDLVQLAGDLADDADRADAAGGRRRRPAREGMAGEMVVIYLTETADETVRTWSAAADLLGAGVVVLGPDEFQRGCGATVADVARTAGLYGAAVVAVTDDVDLRRLADVAEIPVVDGRNRGDDACSGVADVLARRNRCPVLDRPHVVDVGDGDGVGAVAAGLAEAAAGLGQVDRTHAADLVGGPGLRDLLGFTGVADLTDLAVVAMDVAGLDWQTDDWRAVHGALPDPAVAGTAGSAVPGAGTAAGGGRGTAVLAAVQRRPGVPDPVADPVADRPRTGDDLPGNALDTAAGAPARRSASRAAAAERPTTCSCEPLRARAAHRVHAAAAILLALHEGRLTGARRS